jgi:hypothetical protein
MANTKAQIKAQQWIIEEYLSKRFSQRFEEKQTTLEWGGKFKFDAVSEDSEIVANISTSSAKTASGKQAIGKRQKIKADTLYLLHASNANRRLQLFTEKDMLEYFTKEKESGRFPPEVELVFVKLPDKLNQEVQKARQVASKEVTPNIRAVRTE